MSKHSEGTRGHPEGQAALPLGSNVDVTVISGLSGAGRSEAAKALEDLGWFVIDNLPPALIDTMLNLALAPGNAIERVALVIDSRGGAFFDEAAESLERLRLKIPNASLVFLDASDETLMRRYSTSRRRHPMAEDQVLVGIKREREVLSALREWADIIIDTSDLSIRELRAKMAARFGAVAGTSGLQTTVLSFGYKHGLPRESDMVLDVRFLPNPYWVEDLRDLTGLDPQVQDYVLERKVTSTFLKRTKALLEMLLPNYQEEGRHYLTIAIGCTGGRHRSVVLATEIAALIKGRGFGATVIHRDVEKPPVAP